jgi:hypothetical protein
MTTRAERAAQKIVALKQAKADRILALKQEKTDKNKAIAQQAAIVREAHRKLRDKRRYLVGKLADEAGLFGWDDATLTGLFQMLRVLMDTSDPVAVLESLLTEVTSAT